MEQKIDGLVARLVNPQVPAPEPNEQPVDTEPESVKNYREWLTQRPSAPGSWMSVPISFEDTPAEPGQNTIDQTSTQVEADEQYINEVRNIHSFGERNSTNGNTGKMFEPSKELEAPIQNDLIQQILSSGEADGILNDYRQMTASFPFVIIPLYLSSQELYASKPMLFLAIITVASWKDHKRQMALDTIYRTELANRTIIKPRRTLGLVQSVLVYLSW